MLERFVRKERGVDAAVDDPRAARAGGATDLISPARVAGMDPDADDVTLLDALDLDVFERFVDDDRVA
ncbi:MAG: hypothetical protein QM736_15445, partial [Vicinamibacterales bacterium]